jgi:hypothetical protein
METIADYWKAFEEGCVPAGAGAVQRKEMRRTFYAGFHACLVAGLTVADEVGDDDDEGARRMERLHHECLAFAKAIGAGEV